MIRTIYFSTALLLSISSLTATASDWKLGEIKSQECLDNSTVMSSSIKYCHNCTKAQGNQTSWTFYTTCDGKQQTRLVQSKLGCNTSDGKANETDQKSYHTKTANALLPSSTTPCK